MVTVNAVIASAVRSERVRRGLRQDELGERLGWPRTRLSDVESGRRPIRADDLPALCRALEMPFAELISRAEPHDWLVLIGMKLPT